MSGESSPVSCRGAGEIRSRALPRDLLSTRQLSVVHHPVHAAETARLTRFIKSPAALFAPVHGNHDEPHLRQGGCLGGVRGTRVPDMGPTVEHLPMAKVP
jgi:hypothetical protein